MQIVSTGDNLHGMSKPTVRENLINISKCRLLQVLFSMLSDNTSEVYSYQV